ncbi:hypothetical protein VTJ04DRAFT_3670 [Mycothermus thermophilus]|uniref:mitochondrial 37S ribosomal protein mS42 n=1 Tax=Humicola insolens TaxID=85995 RepID=UPI003741F251
MMRSRLLRIPLRPTASLFPRLNAVRSFSAEALEGRYPTHTLPPLPYENAEIAQNGLGSFMSGPAFSLAWTQYQTHLLRNLNDRTAETEWASRTLKDIILATAREPHHAALFNYASMAHNNHFFFKHLTPTPVAVPADLQRQLELSFGSLETLRREMVAVATAMFGPGYVWLVRVTQPGLPTAFKVLATYAAGSPYPAAHWRRQPVDMNTVPGAGEPGAYSDADLAVAKEYLGNTAAGAGSPRQQQQLLHRQTGAADAKAYAPGGTQLQPVLCVSTWEHAWLWDYGFAGKEQYANTWWEHVNWELVALEANVKTKDMSADAGLPKAGL